MSCIQTSPAGCGRCPAHRHALPDTLRDALAQVGHRIGVWLRHSQTRRALRELDAHLLRDVGLTSEQARGEAAKPFWID